MSAGEWSILVSVVTSVVLALGPWMFKVHAKLAVIATQIAELDDKLEQAVCANRELWSRVAQHDTRLGTHEVQLAHIAQRLNEGE